MTFLYLHLTEGSLPHFTFLLHSILLHNFICAPTNHLSVILTQLFFKKFFGRTSVLFVGPLIPLFWTFGDICPGFQSQGGSFFCVCFLSCVILRFTSGVTPADCVEVSMAAEPFRSTYLQTCPKALVEVPQLDTFNISVLAHTKFSNNTEYLKCSINITHFKTYIFQSKYV